MKEEEFNELLKTEDGFNKDINKKIKKAMRKQINYRVLSIIATLVVIIAGLYYGTSFVFVKASYNPFHENDFLVLSDEGDSLDGFHVLMGTYIRMFYPGKLYYGDSMEHSYEKKGFGSYVVRAKLQNFMDPVEIDGSTNIAFNIRDISLDVEVSDSKALSRIADEFYNENNKWLFDDFWLYYSLEDIKELPESTVLDISLSFDETKSLEDTVKFINEYGDSRFFWIAMGINTELTVNHLAVSNGIPLYDISEYEFTDEANKEYPGFYLNYDFTANNIEESYLSRLKLLIDHEDFVWLVDSLYPNSTPLLEALKNRYEVVKAEGIQAVGLRGRVKKADFLKMIERNQLKFATINDAKFSSLQR